MIKKNHIISLVVAVLTASTLYGGVTIYASDPAGDDDGVICQGTFADSENLTEYVRSGYLITKKCYHREMNDFFNSQLKKFHDILAPEDFNENPNFLAPPNVTTSNYKELCTEENVSGYCTSVRALDIYLGYASVLDTMQAHLEPVSTRENRTLSQTLGDVIGRNQAIEKEKVEAQKVLEATAAAYNEFLIAYPMHREYEIIIENLVKYKQKLKRLRSEVLRFPSNFVDATSLTCN